jgi:hypothetical protein
MMPSRPALLLCIVLVALVASLLPANIAQTTPVRGRLPLQKRNIEIAQPAPYAPEIQGYDKKGDPIYWDPKPHVVPLGGGKYAFKWLGHEGRELTLIYQRPDVIDLVAEALVAQGADRRLIYTYNLRNLRTSKLWLGSFFVQTFSASAEGVRGQGIYAGVAGSFIKEFSVGRWLGFGMMGREPKVMPGVTISVAVNSEDLPGVVECRASGGDLTMKGVGEEPPSVLEDLYLRHDAWPHGYTIGPDERILKMSVKARMQYLTQHLPQMLELGWIEDKATMEWYRGQLEAAKASEVRAQAQKDFQNKLITSEVYGLMSYLLR